MDKNKDGKLSADEKPAPKGKGEGKQKKEKSGDEE
jgi:hypothetical protein